MKLKVVWNNEELYGCEYLTMRSTNEKYVVQSTVIYIEDTNENAHTVDYSVELDEHWITKRVSINVDDNNTLDLYTNGEGSWFNRNRELIDSLNGAIDIDISVTPFSNSLPINRMSWTINQIEDFNMVYISVPSLEIKKVPQSYQYIGKEDDVRYFKYCCYDYETIVSVDLNGLVIDYPNTFKRKL